MRWWQWVVLAIAIGTGVWYITQQLGLGPQATRIEFRQVTVTAEIADTPEARRQGLSGREDLRGRRGMLFVFDEPGYYDFHMKDMQFPIDIIWMDEDTRVVDITRHLDPSTYPATVTSDRPAQYVLEVPAGFAQEYSVERGEQALIEHYE